MAEEKKEAAPAVTGSEAPVMTQGKPSETKSTISVDPASSGKTPPPPGGGWQDMLPMIACMILVFYFLMIRPEKKRREQQLALMSGMKKGDKVVLAVGIHGTIADIDGDDATLIIDPKKDVRIKVRKDAIAGVIDENEKK